MHNCLNCSDKTVVASIDIDRIVNEKNISAIEQCIPTIIQFSVDKEQTELLDANFIKTFRASQLAVEYLLFCKKYLDNTIVLLKKDQRKLKEVFFYVTGTLIIRLYIRFTGKSGTQFVRERA